MIKDSLTTSQVTVQMFAAMVGVIKDGRPVISVVIRGEGNIVEDGMGNKPTIEKLRKKQEQMNKMIQKKGEALVKKSKVNTRRTFLALVKNSAVIKYSYWKNHQKDWDRIFKEAEVRIYPQFFIRRIGQYK